MRLNIKLSIICLACFFQFVVLYAQQVQSKQARMFPYEAYLTTTTKHPDIIELSTRGKVPTGIDRYTKDGIVLTDTMNSASGFSFTNAPFSSDLGLVVEFEYAMYDGKEWQGDYGDGISFFLFDGDTAPTAGSWGGALGYTYTNGIPNSQVPGVDSGYLGIGLDYYGYNQLRLDGPQESREGVPKKREDYRNYGGHRLTIRGASYDATRLKGYPVLYTTQVDNNLRNNSTGIVSATLDGTTGAYNYDKNSLANPIEMRPGRAADESIKYNTVKLTLLPNTKENFMYVSISIDDGNGSVEFLKNFKYTNKIKTFDFNGNLYDLDASIPKTFNMGFAASAGGAYQSQAIKRVRVTLPYGPVIEPDLGSICLDNLDTTIVYKPFDNDYFYNGAVTNPTKGNDATHIDYTSFQFEDEKGYVLDASNPYYYKTKDGIWEYSPTTQEVKFTLLNTTEQNVDYKIYYSVKGTSMNGGPFGMDIYRSEPVLINTSVYYCTVPVNGQIRTKSN